VELKEYMRVFARRWWVILAMVTLSTLGTLMLVMPRPWVYESTGTMLIRPDTGTEGDSIDASDLLIRGVKIGSTFATVARSDLIRKAAESALDPSLDLSGLSVDAELVTDTNIVSVSVQGPRPESVYALAVAIQQEMTSYVDSVDDTYALESLDEPKVPKSPIAPNKLLTIVLGGILGLAMGAGLVLLEHHLVGSRVESGLTYVIDPRTGLYNAAYVRKRLQQEASRARRTGHGFSFVILHAAMGGGDTDKVASVSSARRLRGIARAVQPRTPSEAVVGYLEDGMFAGVLPDVTSVEAEELLLVWASAAGLVFSRNGEGAPVNLRISTGACHYRGGRFFGDADAVSVASVLIEEAPSGVNLDADDDAGHPSGDESEVAGSASGGPLNDAAPRPNEDRSDGPSRRADRSSDRIGARPGQNPQRRHAG
jgi:capsular polysaccharide biosynthesis protein/GGDEF domain-containing protein